MPEADSLAPTSAARATRDARELRRAVFINTLGNALKLGVPVLLAFATNAYGARRWGVFIAAQAVLMILVRLAALGLDKALLWWTAGRPPGEGSRAVLSTLLLATCSATLVAAAFAVLGARAGMVLPSAPDLAWAELLEQTRALRIMLLALVPFVATELLLHAVMGQRQMAPQVWVRDTFVPVSTIGLAVLFFYAGAHETGLAWAFTCANWLALPLAFWAYHRVYRERPERRELPRELVKYAWPLWLNEITNSFFLRVDMLILAVLVDASLLGIWGIISQFGNAMRAIRRAFDPIVSALSANIASHHDPERLRQTYSYATQLISLTQFPIFAFFIAFRDVILPLYGAGFEAGALPLGILAGFWLLNGASGLAGIVVAGYGRSRLALYNTLLGLAAQVALLYLLVPHHGLAGAALAVGGSYTLQNVVQLIQMRVITGSLNYSRRALQPLRPALGASAIGIATWLSLGAVGLGWIEVRVIAFLAFLSVYAGLTYVDYGQGKLSGALASDAGARLR